MRGRGRPKVMVKLTKAERNSLEVLAISPTCGGNIGKRAKLILLSSAGLDNSKIAKRLGFSEQTVAGWRQRYLSQGIGGLQDKPRSGRSCEELTIPDDDHGTLTGWSNSRSLPQYLVERAKIVLLAAEGRSNPEISSAVGVSSSTVRRWKSSYRQHGIDGLHDEYRPGRPRTYLEEEIAGLLKKTLESKPEGATHWSCRTMAKEAGVSASTVSRVWRLFSIKPHKQEHFKISTDPFFVDKVVDVCGLYLNPPDNALVLCVDEKSQCQALERTQPVLPTGFGYAEGVTENYFRHGVTTLFAALDVATGGVQIACKKRHRHQEFLSFMNQIKKNIPDALDVHVILDNYITHKHGKIRAWITRNPRFKFHFTPTYASWLNQVETWFGIITSKTIRRDSFTSVKELVCKIEKFTETYNRNSKPFAWTATPEEIFAKLGRLCEKIGG